MLNLDSDTLWMSAIRRQMGFDFELIKKKRQITIVDKETGNQKVIQIKQGIMNDAVIEKLVEACMLLKEEHEVDG